MREVRGDHPLREAQRYKRDGGTRLLTRFPLTPGDVVLDIGAHVDGFAADIHAATGASVHLFEPVMKFHAHCQQRFADNPHIHCHAFGLGAVDGRFRISDANEASSLHVSVGDDAETVEVREAGRSVESLGIDSGVVAKSRFLLIQFHTVGDNEAARAALRARLAETHDEIWCYDVVWEAWRARA